MTNLVKQLASGFHKINLANSYENVEEAFDIKSFLSKMMQLKKATNATSIVTCEDNGPNYFKFAAKTASKFGKIGEHSSTFTFKNRCFQKNTVTFTKTAADSFELVFDVSEPTSITCSVHNLILF